MNQGYGGASLLQRALGAAATICLITVLLVISVHLVESIATVLLIAGSVIVGVSFVVLIIQYRRRNRYW